MSEPRSAFSINRQGREGIDGVIWKIDKIERKVSVQLGNTVSISKMLLGRKYTR